VREPFENENSPKVITKSVNGIGKLLELD